MARSHRGNARRERPTRRPEGSSGPGVAPHERDLVVFRTLNDATCSECGRALARGSLLRLEDGAALCLGCADLDHLVFLPRGNAALTRRASRSSTLRVVVVRFSRARKRYERQGVLVEEDALARAEEECLADADARAARQARDAASRAMLDAAYVASFAERIGDLFPGCPAAERNVIANHACEVRSGRVGRTAAAKELDGAAVELAVQAHVRHRHTSYDRLLGAGIDRAEARREVSPTVEAVLDGWRTVTDRGPAG